MLHWAKVASYANGKGMWKPCLFKIDLAKFILQDQRRFRSINNIVEGEEETISPCVDYRRAALQLRTTR
ncbi:hypothetical protein JCM17844_30050 [Iodidimonas gelatinilytica]|uniref:Uncharacterized protein n=1 Tax=Iodidimonas gelatinilytica TaxID=1236966 RepID=A0A5A7MWC5_9PROT|nr:hypothetical protein JCM17844_30050 [Iodidimonas gelatinilytica]